MCNPLISVIVPVYNVEKYINKCVDSIINQTYENLEIILVDDGSPDKCGEICDEYAMNDSRIKVIHKDNGGLSSARNVGLRAASGDYLTFVDSDDYLGDSYISKSLSLCIENNNQISIMKMLRVQEHDKGEKINTQDLKVELLSPEIAIEYSLLQSEFTCCTPGKLYSKEVFKGITFPEGRLSEDLATCHLIFDSANQISYSHEVGYYYLQRDDSIMHTFNIRRLDALEWAKEIEQYCAEKHPNIQQSSICRTFNVAFLLLMEIPENEKAIKELLWAEIKRTRSSVFTSRKVRYKEKIASVLTLSGTTVTKIVGNHILKSIR